MFCKGDFSSSCPAALTSGCASVGNRSIWRLHVSLIFSVLHYTRVITAVAVSIKKCGLSRLLHVWPHSCVFHVSGVWLCLKLGPPLPATQGSSGLRRSAESRAQGSEIHQALMNFNLALQKLKSPHVFISS